MLFNKFSFGIVDLKYNFQVFIPASCDLIISSKEVTNISFYDIKLDLEWRGGLYAQTLSDREAFFIAEEGKHNLKLSFEYIRSFQKREEKIHFYQWQGYWQDNGVDKQREIGFSIDYGKYGQKCISSFDVFS